MAADILSQFNVVTGSVASQVSSDEYKLIGLSLEKAFDDTELELVLSAHLKAKKQEGRMLSKLLQSQSPDVQGSYLRISNIEVEFIHCNCPTSH